MVFIYYYNYSRLQFKSSNLPFLALTCYYLCKHPEVQERLRDEINSVCTGACPTYEELNSLKFADAIMKEVLRLVPIAGA